MRRLGIILALSLAACASAQDRRNAMTTDAMIQCAQMGYAAQTPEWRACVQQIYMVSAQAAEVRRAQAVRDFTATAAAIAAQPPPPPPAPMVLCRQSYAGIYCQ